jgi:glycosyltransferase involved in cell wall biosynthesis
MLELTPDTPRYSLIIPAHNEANRICLTLAGYLDAFADSEVLLVLNGCTDDTESVAREAAGSRPNLRIVSIEHAVGKGGAVRAGFLAARASVVGYVDADGATPAEEMRRLFDALSAGEDAVIASRWSNGAQVVIAQPMLRRLAGRVFNVVVRLLFGLPYHDTQCGAKVFSSTAIRRISSSLEVANFAFDIDLLYSLRRAGFSIREVPTRWLDMGGSRIDLPRASLEMLLAVFRLRLRYSLFSYVIPLFDRLWPTTTLRVRHGLAVLIVGLRDPQNPQPEESERYLREVGASLVRNGHRVEWLCARASDAESNAILDGIKIKRVGNRLSARAAIPFYYLRKLRNRFDIVVEVQHGLPLLSPLFSLKPKICLMPEPATLGSKSAAVRRFGTMLESLRRRIVRAFYHTSRFIAMSPDHERYLELFGIDRARITSLHQSSRIAAFLDAVYAEVSRDNSSYVLDGTEWSIVPRRSRVGIGAPDGLRKGNAERLLGNGN